MMNFIPFLKQTTLYQNVTDAQLKRVSQDMVTRRYTQGAIIFNEGDPGEVLYMIQTGQVRIFIHGLDGSETSVILFGRPGDIFGELAVIDGLPRSATAAALDDTVLLTINREAFRQHMRHMPQLAYNFMQELTRRVRYNTQQMNSLTSLPVSQRLARQLVELAQDYGRVTPKGVTIHIPLTQQHLASLIGATRESINKCLRDFRRRNWILITHGRITILDPDALRAQTAV
ncbi:MAG TPA: Crp/Fnr family transcriptional regulator [Chloroflexi bacterium]|nr:Crp/Fnr family transcriptional regulator [Chloroflexota bacterium]